MIDVALACSEGSVANPTDLPGGGNGRVCPGAGRMGSVFPFPPDPTILRPAGEDGNATRPVGLGLVWLCVLGLLSFAAGCSSTGSSRSGSHAGVTIHDRSVTDVVLTTREVFGAHDFRLARAETDRMILERPGTRGDQVKYGTFGSSSVIIRAKVDIQELGAGTFFLRCDVFAVRDAGQSVLEDESRLVLFSAKPYQAILDEVGVRLNPPPAP